MSSLQNLPASREEHTSSVACKPFDPAETGQGRRCGPSVEASVVHHGISTHADWSRAWAGPAVTGYDRVCIDSLGIQKDAEKHRPRSVYLIWISTRCVSGPIFAGPPVNYLAPVDRGYHSQDIIE